MLINPLRLLQFVINKILKIFNKSLWCLWTCCLVKDRALHRVDNFKRKCLVQESYWKQNVKGNKIQKKKDVKLQTDEPFHKKEYKQNERFHKKEYKLNKLSWKYKERIQIETIAQNIKKWGLTKNQSDKKQNKKDEVEEENVFHRMVGLHWI